MRRILNGISISVLSAASALALGRTLPPVLTSGVQDFGLPAWIIPVVGCTLLVAGFLRRRAK